MTTTPVANPTPASVSASPPRPTRRRGRWKRVLPLSLLILIVIIAVVVQVVLWTSVPRRIVIRRLEQQLGLKVSIQTLQTNWLGHSKLHGMTLSLPLSDKPLVEMPDLEVRHTNLVAILIGKPVTLRAMDLQHPTVWVSQARGGRWNVQDAIETVIQAMNAEPPDNTPLVVPRVDITDAVVHVTDGAGRNTTLSTVSVHGKADTGVSYHGEIVVPDHVQLSGRLALANDWQHEVNIKAWNLAELAKPWTQQVPADATLDAVWHGRVREGKVDGRLEMAKATAAGFGVSGSVSAAIDASTIELQPESLVFTTQQQQIGSIQLAGGRVALVNGVIKASDLELVAYGGPVKFTGWYDLNTQVGDAQTAWRELSLPGQVRHSGSLNAHVSRPFPNFMVVEASLTSAGQTPKGPWRAQVNFGGQGSGPLDFNWRAESKELVWESRQETIKLDGLAITGSVRRAAGQAAPTIRLESARLPSDERVSARGFYALTDGTWDLHIEGQRFPLHPIEGAEFAFEMDANGDHDYGWLKNFTLRDAGTTLIVEGAYHYSVPKPVKAVVTLLNRAVDNVQPGETPSPLRGTLSGKADLEGTLLPLGLTLTGQLHGQNVVYQDRPVGNILLHVAGSVDGEKVDVRTETLRLLGGDWDMHGIFSFAGRALNTHVSAKHLSVRDVGELVFARGLGGTVDGEWDIYVPATRFNPARIRSHGQAVAHNVTGPDPRLTADEIRITSKLEEGRLELKPIQLKRGDYGRGQGEATWSITDPRHVDSTIALSAWPVDLPNEVHADVWVGVPAASLDLPDARRVDAAGKQLRASAQNIDIRCVVQKNDQSVGAVHVLAAINERTAEAQNIEGNFAGGTVRGKAVYSLDDALKTRASFKWERLDGELIANLIAPMDGLTGRMSGSLQVEATETQRALEPLNLHIRNSWENGKFRTLPLVDLTVNGYINLESDPDSAGGRTQQLRVVLDDRPGHLSLLHAGEGNIYLWGRVSRHGNDLVSTQGQLQFDHLNLEQVLHAADPDVKETPGRMSGRIMLLYDSPVEGAAPRYTPAPTTTPVAATTGASTSPTRDALREFLTRVYGEGQIHLSEANLANIGAVSFVYNALNVFQKVNQPTGTGDVDFRLERDTLRVTKMIYYNRGTELRAILSFPQIWDMPNSPIEGTVAGLARPLRDIKLPFIQDFESAFGALQSGLLTSVTVTGTVNHYKIVPSSFKALGDDMKRFFKGDASSAQ